jgi:hypothetical protein
MAARDDFWLQVHDLSLLVEPFASDLAPRIAQLSAEWQSYPPPAREQLAEEFRLLLSTLQALDKQLPAPVQEPRAASG